MTEGKENNNYSGLLRRLNEITDKHVVNHKDADPLMPEVMEALIQSGIVKPQLQVPTEYASWWGDYHNRVDGFPHPLHLVLDNMDFLDVIVSGLKFPSNLDNLQLHQTQRKGLVVDEISMRDLKLVELAHAISQTQTKAGYRMLEYLIHFPSRDLGEIVIRQEMFQELVDNPQLIDSLKPYFAVMGDNEQGFVDFTFYTKRSLPPQFVTFNEARTYLSAAPAVLSVLKNAKSRRLNEISQNLEHMLESGDMRRLYNTVINRDSTEVVKLAPGAWTKSLSDRVLQQLQGMAPLLAAFEHGKVNVDFRTGGFIITPRPEGEPIEWEFPINMQLDLGAVRSEYFNRNLLFNLHYTMGLIEAICSVGSLPKTFYPQNVAFPTFSNAERYSATVNGSADPYLLLNHVNVVRNGYKIDGEDGEKRGYIITGPNSGGKTVYVLTLPKLQALAQIGAPIPVKSADLSVADRIYTLRPTLHEEVGEGRYLHSLRRGRGIIENVTPKSLVSIDDFEGTDPEDSYRESLVILQALSRIGAGVTMSVQDKRIAEEVERSQDGLYKGILPVKVEWEETPQGEVNFLYNVVPGVGRSIGQAATKSAGMDQKSLNQLMENRGF